MSVGSTSKLCRVVASDGVSLEGLLQEGEPTRPDFPVSALIVVHGTGSHFYAGGMLERFSHQARDAGLTVLRGNTRGHDLVTRIASRQGAVWGGAAFETISDCRKDLAAWIGFLQERGHSRIGLVGHSMGAVKAIYAQAHDQHPEVGCVIGLSPPRFCHERFLSHPACGPFREDLHTAQSLVDQGQGGQLLSVRQPLPLLLTAEGFLAKYGPHDEYDFVKHLPNLNCPGLILVGSESVRTTPAFAGHPDDLRQLLKEHPAKPLAFELIDGADTGYSTCQDKPFHHVEHWLHSLAK
ncbi:MAG: alpha/beta fold hydrolase [Planctomycetaceae bacterium]|nr:alpha/beta fold hydrolase [Planctomycetaceae bacterium]